MIDALLSALEAIVSIEHMLFLAGGVLLGLTIGILPGLGGIAGLSLLMPFIYGMDTVSALAMLIGLVAVIPTSDTFTSVLMGIPGSSASQATVLDGFPLAKQGKAAYALGAAFSASLMGGLIGAVVLTAFVLIARPVILFFGSAELFMLAVLGLSMVGVLAGSSLPKGLSACGLGLLVGSIGGAPATGEFRMSFDISYLMDGIPLVVIGLGMFAFPEIIDLCRQNRSISKANALGTGWFEGLRDMIRHKWLCLRCAAIGCVVGALPGLGGSVVDWIAYGHVVQTSKDKSQFGRGDIRGVLAPESANNAKEGGGLVPTLLFGIPGSGSMAVFLGGMVLLGIEPGPSLVESQLDLTYTIVWSLALANVIGAGTCLFLSPVVARLTTIPYHYLAPFMIAVIFFAAFQATRDFLDMFALLVVGVLGVYMKRFGWPRPAFLIGFVLAGMSETYLYQALQFYSWGFLLKPGVVVIALITLVSVWYGARNVPHNPADEEDESRAINLTPQAIFAGVVVALFAFGLYDGLTRSFLGGVFPAGLSAVMLVISGIVFVKLAMGKTADAANYDHEIVGDHVGQDGIVGLGHYVYWITGFVAGIALVGFLPALIVFFAIFLRVKARATWARTGLLTAAPFLGLVGLARIMVLEFPGGLLQSLVDLPWPFG
ncbi:tripartite tricarboxylate transporter permease [Ruegeria lacuscaerulensis]|uniref:tripartite tricarboxylate transporter permease n=1 Tax=Ruegeria lacuscaerulensis TaxID=55218 RepID=UPI00147D4B04|nr:tripartite tricarboxylate transporter permease [Ruegeria lacuscaerulensis]